MQSIDRSCFHRFIGHFDEGKSPLPASVPLERQGTVCDLSMGRKQFNDVFLLCAEGQIADENAHFPIGPLMKKADGA